MERESGYYWVKTRGEWEIAEWFRPLDESIRGCWLFTGSEESVYTDKGLEQIDERRIVRVKHFENFTFSPYEPENCELSNDIKKIIDDATKQAIKEFVLKSKIIEDNTKPPSN